MTMLDKLRQMKWLALGAVGAGLVLPNAAGAEERGRGELPEGDRYERVIPERPRGERPKSLLETEEVRSLKDFSTSNTKTGPEAAKEVVRAARKIGREHNLTCRVRVTRLGAIGIVECKGSSEGKKKLGREIKKLVRQGKIIRPQGYDWYIGVWNQNDQKPVRIDRVFFGYFGIPA
jgi:hypothetical protein